ncbi:hypothetical protein [Bartonella schoenbuchensis]|uniref:hypothetical protein n=1 Tax=Bartonella schoenbuchensis TaxID=165694 RepID=UPI003145034F
MSRFDALDPPLDQEDGSNNKGFLSFIARYDPFLKHINRQDRRYNRKKPLFRILFEAFMMNLKKRVKKGLKI